MIVARDVASSLDRTSVTSDQRTVTQWTYGERVSGTERQAAATRQSDGRLLTLRMLRYSESTSARDIATRGVAQVMRRAGKTTADIAAPVHVACLASRGGDI